MDVANELNAANPASAGRSILKTPDWSGEPSGNILLTPDEKKAEQYTKAQDYHPFLMMTLDAGGYRWLTRAELSILSARRLLIKSADL